MELLMQGVVLMVIGMATVFSFLVLLILAMNGSAAFFDKFAYLFPKDEPVVAQKVAMDSVAEVAVALAAIRAKRG